MKKILIVAVLFCGVAFGTLAQEEALSAVGALGASYMYTSYLAIGTLADGHYYEVYDDETAVQLMEEIKSLANATNESLQELLGSDIITADDFSFINEIITTVNLLYKEAESYQNYIQT